MDRLGFVARAVTPPYRPRRFDARFFIANAEDVLSWRTRPKAGTSCCTRWFPMAEAEALDLPAVTRFVLGEIKARLGGETRPPAYLRWSHGAHRLDRL